jgi:hypothetical protein
MTLIGFIRLPVCFFIYEGRLYRTACGLIDSAAVRRNRSIRAWFYLA